MIRGSSPFNELCSIPLHGNITIYSPIPRNILATTKYSVARNILACLFVHMCESFLEVELFGQKTSVASILVNIVKLFPNVVLL